MNEHRNPDPGLGQAKHTEIQILVWDRQTIQKSRSWFGTGKKSQKSRSWFGTDKKHRNPDPGLGQAKNHRNPDPGLGQAKKHRNPDPGLGQAKHVTCYYCDHVYVYSISLNIFYLLIQHIITIFNYIHYIIRSTVINRIGKQVTITSINPYP